MWRRGLRKETVHLDKKIWDWSLTEPSASTTEIKNFAKKLFCEAGFENFKASNCWYRRWRNRWRNSSDKTEEESNNPTELKRHSSENKLQKINSVKNKRKISKSTKDDINNTVVPSKRPNPGTGQSKETDKLQISSCSDNDELSGGSNRAIQIEEPNEQVVISSDGISQSNSVGQKNYVVIPHIEFSDISPQSTKLNSKYCSQLGISDGDSSVMQLEHSVSSFSTQEDGIRVETLMNKNNNCSFSGIGDDYPVKTHNMKDSRSSLLEMDNKIVDTASLMNEIDSSLDQINDDCCFKTQISIPISQTNESDINVRNCGTIDGIRGGDEAHLEGDSNSKTENSFNYEVNKMNDQINQFSCGNAKLQTLSSDYITNQIMNCENYCINEKNAKTTTRFENFGDVSNESISPNFTEANFEGTTNSTDRPNKIAAENFVEISSDSVFPIFSAANFEETTNRSNELVTELTGVGLDLCSKDQHSLELMKVINNNFNRHSENSVSSDNLDACLMSPEFQIPGLSLGSEEVFEFYRNSLFMESNYMFCENCDDFHMNEIEGCEHVSNYEEIISLKSPDEQFNSGEQESADKNNEEINKEKDVCTNDGGGSCKQFSPPGIQMQRKQGEISKEQRERKLGERYLPKFKAKVVAYTTSHTIKATALKFNVHEGTVSRWVNAKLSKNKEQDFEPYKESKSFNVEQQFLNWLKSMRETRRPVSQALISEKLQDLMKPEENCEKITEKWLENYLERLKKENVASQSDQVVKDKKISKKYVLYSLSFKREVALYAEMFSQKAASRDFGVARKRVCEWLQAVKNSQTQDEKLNSEAKELGKRDSSRYVADATIDRNILDWYKSQSVPPTSKQVREMGLKLYADEGYDVTCSYGWWRRWSKRHQVRWEAMSSLDNHLLEWLLGQLDRNVKVTHASLLEYVSKIGTKKAFSKVSNGWVIRFCRRYPTLLQRTPQFNTNLPPAMEMKVLLFRKRIQELISEFGIRESDIGTIDEIPLRFTDTGIHSKEQLIRKCGFDNCQASLLVACLANGTLLPSTVIVKGSQTLQPDLALSNEDVTVFVRENSCLDSKILLHWIKNVWPRTQKTSILVSNNFQSYKDATVGKRLSAISCKHEFFPPGCLSKLQPIRVALSTAFQDGLHNFWKEKIKNTSWDDEISPMNLPSHQDIVDWTTQIHRKLAANFQEEIALSFKKTLLAENKKKFEQDKTIQTILTNQESLNKL